MEIIRADDKTMNNRVLKYKLTSSPETEKVSTLADQIIDVEHFCIYDDTKTDKDGKETTSTILTLMTRQGELFGTNSKSVRDEFLKILEVFGDDLNHEGGYIPIRIMKGVSKNNRTFYTCTYGE